MFNTLSLIIYKISLEPILDKLHGIQNYNTDTKILYVKWQAYAIHFIVLITDNR